jgi:hypothetical protein
MKHHTRKSLRCQNEEQTAQKVCAGTSLIVQPLQILMGITI